MAHATIIVEDGSIVANANSYVSVAEYEAWAEDRQLTVGGHPEAQLIKAMDFLETLSFIGDKKTRDQSLQWPRDNVYIDGFEYESTEIPQALKEAQYAIAASILAGIDPLAAITRAVKREKVDVIEVEYMDNASATDISRSISRSIQKLIRGGSYGGVNFRVTRG